MATKQQSEESKSKSRANQDLEDIETLRKNPAFQRYFERRIIGELTKYRDEVLYNRALGKDDLYEARKQFLAVLDVSKMLYEDEAGCRNILESGSTDE